MKSLRYAIYVIFLVICFLGIYPYTSFAGIDLPWSTTYNCSPWTWTTSSNPNCGGLAIYQNAACTESGSNLGDQIISTANNPSGNGGLGQRHWLGDNHNDVSGGLKAVFNTPQDEFWMRWYVRWQNGFKWGGSCGGSSSVGEKIIYVYDTKSSVSNNNTFMLQGSSQFEEWLLSSQQTFFCNNCGWNTIYANGPVVNGNHTSDGSWHWMEVHEKRESAAGATDGVFEAWIDGTRVMNVTNANYGLAPSDHFWYVQVGSNVGGANNSDGACNTCFYVDFDEIAVKNTGHIGPLSGSSTPTPPTNVH